MVLSSDGDALWLVYVLYCVDIYDTRLLKNHTTSFLSHTSYQSTSLSV